MKSIFIKLNLFLCLVLSFQVLIGASVNDNFNDGELNDWGAIGRSTSGVEDSTMGDVFVQDGKVALGIDLSNTSYHGVITQTITPVSGIVYFTFTFSADKGTTRNFVTLRNSNGNVVTRLSIGKCQIDQTSYENNNIAITTSMQDNDYLPQTETLIGANLFSKETDYLVIMKLDTENNLVTVTIDGVEYIEATDVPFVNASDDIASFDFWQYYTYGNSGYFWIDNILLSDEDKGALQIAISDTQEFLDDEDSSYCPDSILTALNDSLEVAIDIFDSSSSIERIDVMTETLNTMLEEALDYIKTEETIVYKTIDGTDLEMDVYYPGYMDGSTTYQAIVFIHGGAWSSGSKSNFSTQAEYFASRGMVAFSIDYRLTSSGYTVYDCVRDAKSAMRYIKANCEYFQIDSANIVASGGSAGGHLAAATAYISSYTEDTDDLSISCKPTALVLFNPVIDNGPDGYGYNTLGDNYVYFSPLHNLSSPALPTLFMLGTSDDLIPVSTGEKFQDSTEYYGGRCDLALFEDQEHGFFNFGDYLTETIYMADTFLCSLGYIDYEEDPITVSINEIQSSDEYKIVMPTIINNNSAFLPINMPANPQNYSMRVYNLQGRTIYTSSSLDQPWYPGSSHKGIYIYFIQSKVLAETYRGKMLVN
jgi:acetyl esterase/lipase